VLTGGYRVFRDCLELFRVFTVLTKEFRKKVNSDPIHNQKNSHFAKFRDISHFTVSRIKTNPIINNDRGAINEIEICQPWLIVCLDVIVVFLVLMVHIISFPFLMKGS